jgi:hypothetical protein
LEIHIKTNKVKHFRPLQQRKRNWWTKKRGEKNPFGEEREKDQNHEEGSKSRKIPSSSTRDIFQNWSTTNSLLSEREKMKNLQQLPRGALAKV